MDLATIKANLEAAANTADIAQARVRSDELEIPNVQEWRGKVIAAVRALYNCADELEVDAGTPSDPVQRLIEQVLDALEGAQKLTATENHQKLNVARACLLVAKDNLEGYREVKS